MHIPTNELAPDDVPAPGASDAEIIRFAQTLDGYRHVGGEARDLGACVRRLDAQPPHPLSVDDLRVLLFARQRAHHHQGDGWSGEDPLMDEMRSLTAAIRGRLERSG